MHILIVIRISIASYRDKSWHSPKKISVAFFFFIIIQNMVSEMELEALDSINTFKLKNTRGRLAFLTWEYTHLAGSNKPVQNKKACLLFYCKHCYKIIYCTVNF